MDTENVMDFKMPKANNGTIKVIGIGGGGVNAVNYMYKSGIHGVNFAVCNTDKQSFEEVEVPVKVTLGGGLGAGGVPEKAREEFEKSAAEVEKLLDDGTEMVFVAAGMGGGTGSGAGPLLAKMAKEKGKLTVGVVTLPFLFEKTPRIITALDAVEEMNKNVDALIVINNESLKLFYSEECLIDAFKKPDEILAMAVKSIAEIITVKGMINRDFEDVKTTMENSGVALVSYGFGQGENRLDDAITNALKSPLLNNNDIYNAKRVLFYISLVENSDFKTAELTKHMDAFMARFDNHIKMIWGFGIDKSLKPEQEVKFTIIATGFSIEAVPKMKERICERTKDNADKREEDDKRVEIVYGPIDVDVNKVKIKRVQQSSIIVLTMDEMDNDDLITFMEGSPTHSRTQKEMEKIRKPASIIATSERQTGKLSVSDTEEIITFTF